MLDKSRGETAMRRHYIDNLRWLTLLILVPYHTAMAWNVWNEPNYIFFEANRAISSIVVFFSPFFMPLLFVLAGISTRLALRKRTGGQYLAERAKRLLAPFLFGTLVLMPVMTFIADRFNYSYSGGFFEHYGVFFTKFTDLTGADGGFSMGQFWFLLYLMVISAAGIGIIKLPDRLNVKTDKTLPFWGVLLLGLPLPLLGELLSIGGKSLAEYLYLFMLGYFVFSADEVINKAEKYRWPLLSAGLTASAVNVYLFLWSGRELPVLNTAAKFIAEWTMIIALLGMAKRYLNTEGRVSAYMSRRSFLVYIWHFIWVVLFQYLLYAQFGNNTLLLFAGTTVLAFIATFICSEITLRIPALCFLTGTKHMKNNKMESKGGLL